jgi:hypothetical protein
LQLSVNEKWQELEAERKKLVKKKVDRATKEYIDILKMQKAVQNRNA